MSYGSGLLALVMTLCLTPVRAGDGTGEIRFRPVPEFGGADPGGTSRGVGWGDFTGDGFPDLVVSYTDGERLFLYRNVAGKRLQPSTGFGSMNEPLVHFGLGTEETIRVLRIRWPSGRVDRHEEVPGNHRYLAIESGALTIQPRPGNPR